MRIFRSLYADFQKTALRNFLKRSGSSFLRLYESGDNGRIYDVLRHARHPWQRHSGAWEILPGARDQFFRDLPFQTALDCDYVQGFAHL